MKADMAYFLKYYSDIWHIAGFLKIQQPAIT